MIKLILNLLKLIHEKYIWQLKHLL